MRDFRVTDDVFTGPATDEWFDEWFDEFDGSIDEDREPDAIDRYLARRERRDADPATDPADGIATAA